MALHFDFISYYTQWEGGGVDLDVFISRVYSILALVQSVRHLCQWG